MSETNRLSLNDYLTRYKFNMNPFIERAADDEKDLPKYFVQVPYFDSVLGNPAQAATTIYFAARGNGKSATARMVKYSLTETKTFGPVLVVDFKRDDFEELLQMPGVEGNIEKITKQHYRKLLLQMACVSLGEQRNRLESFSGVEKLDIVSTDLKKLPLEIRQKGVAAIYFLIDGADELIETAGKPHKAAELILPLLADLTLGELPYTAFKFFLPAEIKAELQNHPPIRFDRFEEVSTTPWDETTLLELLKERLVFFSGGAVNSIGRISGIDDLDIRMCRIAQGSPRNLIRLGSFLLDEHLKAGMPEKMTEETYQKGVQRLQKAIEAETGYSSLNLTEDLLVENEESSLDSNFLLSITGTDVYIGGKIMDSPPSKDEFKLLKALYDGRGNTCNKKDLLKIVYNLEIKNDYDVNKDERLNATVKRLRQKLKKETGRDDYIKSIWGVGFRLTNYEPTPQ